MGSFKDRRFKIEESHIVRLLRLQTQATIEEEK
jgi:hypothetical protein